MYIYGFKLKIKLIDIFKIIINNYLVFENFLKYIYICDFHLFF